MDFRVQIADFGISHVFEDGKNQMALDKNASPLFSPPETFQGTFILADPSNLYRL